MSQGIYKITSPSGKIYIGQSRNIKKRFYTYRKAGCKTQTRLHNSFAKYGVDNHILEVIELCDKDMLNKRERYYQDLYNVIGNKGLNCLLVETNIEARVVSSETREKLRLASTGRKCSKEAKMKIGNAHRGKIITERERKQISITKTGVRGYKHREETKRKISIARIGKKFSKEHVKNMSIVRLKKVICIAGSRIFNGAQEAADFIGVPYSTLTGRLNGRLANNTSMRYI
jgi:group I intron endonuclease